MLYCTPVFTRTSGLGNKLFPFARCALFASTAEATMLEPLWGGVRRGPLLRGGHLTGGVPLAHVLGKILLLGNFTSPGPRALAHRWRLLHSPGVITEPGLGRHPESGGNADRLVTFSGDGSHFRDLTGSHDFILRSLRARIQPNVLARADAAVVPQIVLNVRLARDFRHASSMEAFRTEGALKTPVTWFCSVLTALRAHAGTDVPALIISDGRDSELAPLLMMPNVARFTSTTAVEDLLTLSRAKVIVGSGGSSFTAWGAFLSQAHVITIVGQNLSWFGLDAASGGCVVEWDPESRDGGVSLRDMDRMLSGVPGV